METMDFDFLKRESVRRTFFDGNDGFRLFESTKAPYLGKVCWRRNIFETKVLDFESTCGWCLGNITQTPLNCFLKDCVLRHNVSSDHSFDFPFKNITADSLPCSIHVQPFTKREVSRRRFKLHRKSIIQLWNCTRDPTAFQSLLRQSVHGSDEIYSDATVPRPIIVAYLFPLIDPRDVLVHLRC